MKINRETGEVKIGDTKANLTRYEIRALEALNKPGITTYQELYKNIYGVAVNELEESERRLLYSTICRIRRKLKGKIKIHRRNQYGYELEVVNGKI